ncbi:MAG: glutamate 5-kinase, partial [Pseudomonadota bacterium]
MSGPYLQTLRRIVVKIGSALLVDETGEFAPAALERLATDIAQARSTGQEVLVVSSGAVAIGCHVLGVNRPRARLDELQAAAAAGQVQLVQAWQSALSQHGLGAAQVLLTPDDTEHRRRFLNARGTLNRLLDHGVVPVINENDTVATDELRYGDNDRLAARVAQLVMADGLILLSDVDGLYSTDPRTDPSAKHIPLVAALEARVFRMAGESSSAVGSGGMRTKLEAARIATHAGCMTIIANGHESAPLRSLAAGTRCTVFTPEGTPAAARKQWLAGRLEIRGSVKLDSGAVDALTRGGSLLPVGVTGVDGEFRRGDAITLLTPDGEELGRGLVAYDTEEVAAILGCHSEDIESRLGYRGRSVVVHRDD